MSVAPRFTKNLRHGFLRSSLKVGKGHGVRLLINNNFLGGANDRTAM